MARIEWVLACDLAFFDRQDRLCLIGVSQRFPVPALPIALSQLMLVAKLTDLRMTDEVDLTVSVRGPAGLWTTPSSSDGMLIEMAGEYVLVTLRGLPLMEEGMHRFEVGLSGQTAMSVSIPVLAVGSSRHAEVH